MSSLVRRLRGFLRSAAEEAGGSVVSHLSQTIHAASNNQLVHNNALNVARLLVQNQAHQKPNRLRDVGFKVFSQFDEDGVIQYLVGLMPEIPQFFVEIGVEDYRESNTRLLLEKDNWRGLILDSGPEASVFLRESGLDIMRTIDFRQAFITTENIERLLDGVPKDLGLLSIDIDGMDYHIWRAIQGVRPAIVSVEYNSTFGPKAKVTVPYQPDFTRSSHHFSELCYGASLAALADLGDEKGYALVGTSTGPNAFFVRRALLATLPEGVLPEVSVEEAYYEARYRESKTQDGSYSYLSDAASRRQAMADAKILDLVTNEIMTVGKRFG